MTPLLSRIGLERRDAAFLFVCLALVPAFVGLIKFNSGTVCASELVRYGGTEPDEMGRVVFSRMFKAGGESGCWPSGHASGGFALLALGFLPGPASRRRALWLAGVAVGSVMGAYQVARGAHFASHIVITALMAQFLICVLASLWYERRKHTTPADVRAIRSPNRRTNRRRRDGHPSFDTRRTSRCLNGTGTTSGAPNGTGTTSGAPNWTGTSSSWDRRGSGGGENRTGTPASMGPNRTGAAVRRPDSETGQARSVGGPNGTGTVASIRVATPEAEIVQTCSPRTSRTSPGLGRQSTTRPPRSEFRTLS